MNTGEPRNSTPQSRTAFSVLAELAAQSLGLGNGATTAAPHLRRRTSVSRLLLCFVLASIPALLMGLWNLGAQTLESMLLNRVAALPGMPWAFFTLAGFDVTSVGPLARFVLGAAYFLPLLIMTMATGVFWEVLFATLRRRRVDPGWLMACWLYALMLPASMPASLTMLGISFGLVFGKHIFGGTGRYIVSPALLGILFLQFGYPGHFSGAASFIPVPDLAAATTWSAVVSGGLNHAADTGLKWIDVFLGIEIGAPGAASAMLCLAGAAMLIYTGAASARTITGAFAGLIAATAVINAFAAGPANWHLPWYWHIALGQFAFAVAFIATDPTPAPMTTAGRWLQGLLIGVLTALIRAFNPAHPDGTLYAILLATLATPVIDHFVIYLRVLRWQRRWKSSP